MRTLLTSLLFFGVTSLVATQGRIAQTNRMDTWVETFGEKEKPALLLIMGSLCQGILWPTEFCEQLAEQGFYVIRYDHRDAGYSTCVDFQKQPYDLLDMAKDAVALLDFLDVQKANLCGISMGSAIAELVAAHFPHRVQSLTLIACSCDFRPAFLTSGSDLPPPSEQYLQWRQQFLRKVPQNDSERLEQLVERWSILNGNAVPFEEECYRELYTEFLERLLYPNSLPNHMEAIKKSFQLILEAPFNVHVPTVVVHGTADPIFAPVHGEMLSKLIRQAKFVLLEGFGHVPNCAFYPHFIKEITEVAQRL